MNSSENIFGHQGLKIDLWMAADTLKGFLRFKAQESLTADQCDGVKPDPIIEPLRKILAPDQVTDNLNEFETMITKSDSSGGKKFEPFGSKISEFEDDSNKTFEIYQSTTSDQGFKDYHEHLQFWIMFYIDAASYIDIDDDRWIFFSL